MKLNFKKSQRSALLIAILTMLAYTGCAASKSDLSSSMADAAPAENAIMNEAAGADADADAVADVAGEDAPAVAPEEKYFADDAGDAEFAEFAAEDAVARADSPKGSVSDDAVTLPDDVPVEPVPEESRIGMLTAGEWRDHDNWGFFENLVNTGLVQFPGLGIDPTRRIVVTVTDPSGNPLPNVDVTLEQEDASILWHSVTDQNGNAYLFASDQQTGAKITVQQDDAVQTLALDAESPQADEQGNPITSSREYAVTLETEKKIYPNTEIMFIVDTTGSMGDEMLFLQSDFSAIAEETGDENTLYSVNFYKDEGDEYVTKCSGFTGDVQAIKNQLCAESASGGGDEPEAVAEILQETLSGDMWGQDSVKIAFLIYDAPPHTGTEEILCQAIADASAKGIHLIPVVSSNGSRETELFGRAAAICTNGSYVFLTDDSGIGESHLEPIIGDYEVEKLHDIIVRIIREYKQS